MEEENSGISIGEIFRTIFSQKLLALIVTAVIFLAGTPALYFGYSKGKADYVSTFTINRTIDENGLIQYPSGRTRSYRDLVSLGNLQDVKKSDILFGDVDVVEMYKKGDIAIAPFIDSKTSAVTYKIAVKAKYFTCKGEAASFIEAIAETVTRDILAKVEEYAEEIRAGYEARIGNERKLTYLSSKLSEIGSRFSQMKGLTANASAAVSNLSYKISALTGTLHTYYYETDAGALRNYVSYMSILQRNLENARAALDNLKGVSIESEATGNTIVLNGSEIATYSERASSLEKQIEDYKKYLSAYKSANGVYVIPDKIEASEGAETFSRNLEEVLNEIIALTSTYEYDYYLSTPQISYDGAVATENDLGIVLCAAISLVAGLIVAAVVAYIVGRTKQSKAAENVAQSAVVQSANAAEVSEEENK